jgi:hypothetical protein
MVRATVVAFGIIAVLRGASLAQQDLPPHPTLPACDPNDSTLQLPDLVPETPSDVRVLSRGSYREMQFTTQIGNIGAGPLILEGVTVSNPDGVFTAGYQRINRTDGSQCANAAGLFVYHPQHAHFHFDQFVGYELRSDDPFTGPLAVMGEKMSFCLLDIQPVRGYNPVVYQRQLTTQTCSSAEGIYGISVGWEDVYDRFLPGQSINLDPDTAHQVPVGSYFLINKVNPNGTIWESNVANNTAFVSVNVSLSTRILTGSPPTPGPSPTPGPAPNPQMPRLRPGRIRPTRPPRPARPARAVGTPTPTRTRPGAPSPTPTRTRPVAPTPTPITQPTPTTQPATTSSGPHQPHQPHSPGSSAAVSRRPTRVPRPTRAPRPGAGEPGPTPTPVLGGGPEPVPACENACSYDISQLRLTWYDRLGLTLAGFIDGTAAACPRLAVDPGTSGTFQMVNWLNQNRQNLSLDHNVSFVLGDKGQGPTSDGGSFSLDRSAHGFRFTYKADLPPPARTSSGFQGTPVVFDVCMTVGGNPVKMRMVCQPHSNGLLCHEG